LLKKGGRSGARDKKRLHEPVDWTAYINMCEQLIFTLAELTKLRIKDFYEE